MGFKSVSSKERHSAPYRPDEKLARYGPGALATVKTMSICAKRMDGSLPLAHHFLLIDVWKIEKGASTFRNRCILAERTKVDRKFEIVVKEIDRDEEDERREDGTVKHAVDLTGNHEPIKIKVNELVDTLKQCVAKDYTLTKHNCWKFTHDGFSALILKITEISGDISTELKVKLDKALAEMPSLCLPNDAAPFVKSALCCFGVGIPVFGLGAYALPLMAGGMLGAKGVAFALSVEGLRAMAMKTLLTTNTTGVVLKAGIRFGLFLCQPGALSTALAGLSLTAGVCLVAVGAYKLTRAIQYGLARRRSRRRAVNT
ncbi:hypothetical protein KC19_8G128600 [Ceratodon purpureus]|uniref:Uncharacterized protein n=1 Tax=Ceratodon purpureus TaxID=3225 RepID=A0A8T0H2U0_CERPU|nr:hypothetical protein KC19_8G128600 [Ceratodon purpureus]